MRSFGRHSEKTNGPVPTVGALFSGASSMFLLASSASMYLPKTWRGIMPNRPISVMAGQNGFSRRIVTTLSWTVIPSMVPALPSAKARAPTMSWKVLLRTVFLLRITASAVALKSSPVNGVPSLQVTPGRSQNVRPWPSGATSYRSARRGVGCAGLRVDLDERLVDAAPDLGGRGRRCSARG